MVQSAELIPDRGSIETAAAPQPLVETAWSKLDSMLDKKLPSLGGEVATAINALEARMGARFEFEADNRRKDGEHEDRRDDGEVVEARDEGQHQGRQRAAA